MNNEDYYAIEQQIGYEFHNKTLLQQAFTRKSYTNETHDGENNEVLEFIGDKVLDIVVVRVLSEYFGEIDDRDEFKCRHTEGKLTGIKKKLVESKMLSARIDELGFAKYLIMGNGDRKINAQNDAHVKEDLFEAILGAVAIDSDWNMDSMQDVVEMMLHLEYYLENGFDDDCDYVSLIQQWYQKQTGNLPDYNFISLTDNDRGSIFRTHGYLRQKNRIEISDGNFICELRIDNGEPFVGFGYSKSHARTVAAKLAYNYLNEEGLLFTMSDKVEDSTPENAINQLQELAQKDYCSMPDYNFKEDHDDNGNPIWTCDCGIKGYDFCHSGTSYSKKEAKKQAAYQMLLYVLEKENGRKK